MISTIEETRVPAIAAGSREFTSVPGRWTGLARQLPALPLAILVPFVLIALFADWIAPYDPTEPIRGRRSSSLLFGWRGAARTRFWGPIFRAVIC